jgi:hypothetical protein
MRMTTVLIAAALGVATGCGKQGDNTAKQAGKEVGKTVTDFGAGIGQGVDKSLLINVVFTPELEAQGLAKTTAKWYGPEGGKKVITVHIISKSAFKGTLIAKALTKEGQEIGRALTDVEFTADDGKYTAFKLERDVDTQLVDKCVVDIRK